jgi:hypothetical protein
LVTSVTQAESQPEQQFQQVTKYGNLSVTGKSEQELTPLLQQAQQSQPSELNCSNQEIEAVAITFTTLRVGFRQSSN